MVLFYKGDHYVVYVSGIIDDLMFKGPNYHESEDDWTETKIKTATRDNGKPPVVRLRKILNLHW